MHVVACLKEGHSGLASEVQWHALRIETKPHVMSAGWAWQCSAVCSRSTGRWMFCVKYMPTYWFVGQTWRPALAAEPHLTTDSEPGSAVYCIYLYLCGQGGLCHSRLMKSHGVEAVLSFYSVEVRWRSWGLVCRSTNGSVKWGFLHSGLLFLRRKACYFEAPCFSTVFCLEFIYLLIISVVRWFKPRVLDMLNKHSFTEPYCSLPL